MYLYRTIITIADKDYKIDDTYKLLSSAQLDTQLEKQSKFPRYNMKCRGKHEP